MSVTYKQFGGVRPSSSDDEYELYVVPAATTIVATISVCNEDSSSTTYRVGVNQAGTSPIPNGYWLMYDKEISANDTHQITGVALGTAGRINVSAGDTDQVSFTVDGMEIS